MYHGGRLLPQVGQRRLKAAILRPQCRQINTQFSLFIEAALGRQLQVGPEWIVVRQVDLLIDSKRQDFKSTQPNPIKPEFNGDEQSAATKGFLTVKRSVQPCIGEKLYRLGGSI